jgi:hypothetical protein
VLQAAGAEDRAYLARQRLGLEAQTLELHKVHELTQIQQAQMRVQDGMEKQRQTMQAVKALAAISHDDPDFEVKIAQITHDNPAGMAGPIIDGRIKFLRETAQRQLAARETLNTHAQEVGLQHAAKLGVDPLFKTDAKGLMTPDITGMETAAEAKRAAAAKAVTDSGLVKNGAEVNAAGDTIQKFGPKKDDVPLAIRTKYAESKALIASHGKALEDHETAIKAEEKQNTDAGNAGVGYSKAKEYNDLKVKHDANQAFVGSLEETYPGLKEKPATAGNPPSDKKRPDLATLLP